MKRVMISLFLVALMCAVAFAAEMREVTAVYSTNSTNATVHSSPDYWWTQISVQPLDASNSTTTAASGTATVYVQAGAPGVNATAGWIALSGTIDFTSPTIEIFNGSYYGIRVEPSNLDTDNFVVIARQWKEAE